MFVVATAGHVDHGKTTLVEALTHMRSDRLPEERRREMSIDLGYVWTELPGTGTVAFVDVPGHERFLATAVAGMGTLSAVLFVVAADDPWRPQASEHLAVLSALDVRHAVVAVTRCDRADPGPSAREAAAQFAETPLASSPIVPVSATTGEGLSELRTALASVLGGLPAPDVKADVRLWVDRRFLIRGAGTVVTGTLSAGTLSQNQMISSLGGSFRIRGLECLGQRQLEVEASARVALNLDGPGLSRLSRGAALWSPGAWLLATTTDCQLLNGHVSALPREPLLHIGSHYQTVRVRPLDDEFVRLTLREPLPLRIGDRAVLRDPGDRRLWGIAVVDPTPPKLEQRRGGARVRAQSLQVSTLQGGSDGELRRRGIVNIDTMRLIGASMVPLPRGAVTAGDYVVGPEKAEATRIAIRDVVDGILGEDDALEGVRPKVVAAALELPAADIVVALVNAPLVMDRGLVTINADEEQLLPLERYITRTFGGGVGVIEAASLRAEGIPAWVIRSAHRADQLTVLDDGSLIAASMVQRAHEHLMNLPQPFTVSEARQRFGLSRKHTLAVLLQLDRLNLTSRHADSRRSVMPLPQ